MMSVHTPINLIHQLKEKNTPDENRHRVAALSKVQVIWIIDVKDTPRNPNGTHDKLRLAITVRESSSTVDFPTKRMGVIWPSYLARGAIASDRRQSYFFPPPLC